ncbi:rhomboid family intramembrane serine protease [Corynebacterium casei]|uniref:rhomboid family intramembrane serine protease n=1 Tax=Corynebacterium casei TaxID=160386 RepID=UPI000EC486EC|nr:rhomboid family intramembrane serine protease [Corynebacterium casei]HCJ68353.1 rhomboid family intramembrane serine protease [Corynebacterium casei]
MQTWLKSFYRTAPATLIITSASIILWFVAAFQARSLTNVFNDSELVHNMMVWGPAFELGNQWWTPLSYAFMHLDIGHLTVNMFMLMLIGREVERHFGTVLFVALYISAAISSGLLILTLDFMSPTAGASGALFALMVLLVSVYRSRGADLRAPIVLVAVNVIYTFISAGVSLWGHLGGLFAGIILALCVTRKSVAIHWLGIVGLPIAAFFLYTGVGA